MRIAITGGAGFIGKHLACRLAGLGHEVVVLDTIGWQFPDIPEYKKMAHQDNWGGTGYNNTTVLNYSRLFQALLGVDVVYHLAAMSNTGYAIKSPDACTELNCMGTANVLKACYESEVQRIIVASSSLISASLEGDVVDEYSKVEMNRVIHPYVASKLYEEMITTSYYSIHRLPYTILRFGICYGEMMTPGVVFDNFIRRVKDGKPMLVEGDGRQVRQYMYVGDLVDGCIAVLADKAICETYFVVPSCMTSIIDIAQMIRAMVGGKIKFVPERKDDMEVKICSHEKMLKHLGWSATTSLKVGLEKTLKYYGGSKKAGKSS